MCNYVDQQFHKIINKYHLSYLSDIYELLDFAHCKLHYADLDKDTGGCTVTNNRCHTIIVNKNWPVSYQRFVILHEFSHVKLHSGISTPFYKSLAMDSFVSKAEREANQMALKLLLHIHSEDLQGMTKFQILNYLGLPSVLEKFL